MQRDSCRAAPHDNMTLLVVAQARLDHDRYIEQVGIVAVVEVEMIGVDAVRCCRFRRDATGVGKLGVIDRFTAARRGGAHKGARQ